MARCATRTPNHATWHVTLARSGMRLVRPIFLPERKQSRETLALLKRSPLPPRLWAELEVLCRDKSFSLIWTLRNYQTAMFILSQIYPTAPKGKIKDGLHSHSNCTPPLSFSIRPSDRRENTHFFLMPKTINAAILLMHQLQEKLKR